MEREAVTDVPATGTRFQAVLEMHPDARAALKQRLRAFPEYRSWLQQFSPGVLAAIGDTSIQ